jgi:hypothetical protein
MALNPVYFQVLSPQQANPFGFGMQQGAQIANQMREAKMRDLQNQMLGAQVPYANDMAQADLAIKQAQAPYMNSQTAMNIGTLPYLGLKYTSPMIGNLARVQQAYNSTSGNYDKLLSNPQIAAMLPNHPELLQTLFNTANTQGKTLNAGPAGIMSGLPGGTMPQQMPQSMPMQQLPLSSQQVQKLQQIFPTNGLTTDDIQAANQANQLKLQKQTTDASARQKNLYAANIDKTLGMINPDDLTQYAGSPISKFLNQAATPLGMESKNYDNYLSAANSAKLLAKQVRQFYGDSIQPSVGKELEQLADPATWQSNPTLAKNLFNNFKTVLQQETGTYRDAMQSTAPYRAQGNNNQLSAPSQSKVIGGTTYHKINGQWYAQ